MAIWQFDLALFPRGGPQPWRIEDGHEVPPVQESEAVIAHAWLHQHLGEPSLLLEGSLVFGEDQGNRVDLIFNKDGTAKLSARVDARSSYECFVRELCGLGQLSRCMLFAAEHRSAIEPSVAEVISALQRSRAAAFINNPYGVLRGSHPGG